MLLRFLSKEVRRGFLNMLMELFSILGRVFNFYTGLVFDFSC